MDRFSPSGLKMVDVGDICNAIRQVVQRSSEIGPLPVAFLLRADRADLEPAAGPVRGNHHAGFRGLERSRRGLTPVTALLWSDVTAA
jgi:hypothetical protein